MGLSKSSTAESRRQLKNAAAVLKKAGFYTPKNPRKSPTDYAARLVRRYKTQIEELSSGRAKAVIVPTAEKENVPTVLSKTRGKVTRAYVRKDSFSSDVYYDLEKKHLVRELKTPGGKYTYQKISVDKIPKVLVPPQEAYGISYRRGTLEEIVSYPTYEEFINKIFEYKHKEKNPFEDIEEHLYIMSYESPEDIEEVKREKRNAKRRARYAKKKLKK